MARSIRRRGERDDRLRRRHGRSHIFAFDGPQILIGKSGGGRRLFLWPWSWRSGRFSQGGRGTSRSLQDGLGGGDENALAAVSKIESCASACHKPAERRAKSAQPLHADRAA